MNTERKHTGLPSDNEKNPCTCLKSNKRKNLEFQMLAAVYHKCDHGQYCYTWK